MRTTLNVIFVVSRHDLPCRSCLMRVALAWGWAERLTSEGYTVVAVRA